jgi:hypothetical protein
LTQSWSPACFTSAQKYEECWNYSIHHQQPTLAGHIVFAGDQVRLRSFSIGLINYDWCPSKMEKFEHRHKYVYKGACHGKEKTEIGVMYLQASEYSDCQQPAEVGKGAWDRSSPTTFRGVMVLLSPGT